MNDFGAPGRGEGPSRVARGMSVEGAFGQFMTPVASVTPLPDPLPKRVEIVY